MAEPWFFTDRPPVQLGACVLGVEQARHARAARRLATGDAAAVFDGSGAVGRGRIAECSRARVVLDIEEVHRSPSAAPRLTLAVAVPKGPRQEVLIEKCTELGVAALWPLFSRRSVVRPEAGRVERWRRTAIEACKQCHRAWLPHISAPRALAEVLACAQDFSGRWITCLDGAELPSVAAEENILVIIGPEGGFDAEEQRAAELAGLTRVTLGPAILRVETAALAVAARLRIT